MHFLTQELAIDLGTANTLIFQNDSIVLDEPSIIANIGFIRWHICYYGYFLIPAHSFQSLLGDVENSEQSSSTCNADVSASP